MGQSIALASVFLRETLGPVRLEHTMRDVAELLPPPEAWNVSAEETLPSLWGYRGAEMAFASTAPHALDYIKLRTDGFDGSVSILACDTQASDASLLMLDQQGLESDASLGDMIAFLGAAVHQGAPAAPQAVEVLFIIVGPALQIHVGLGGRVDACFTLDTDDLWGSKTKGLEPGKPLAFDLDNPQWVACVNAAASLHAIYLWAHPSPIRDAASETHRSMPGKRYLSLLERLGDAPTPPRT